MNIVFPSYVTSFLCNCTMQEAMERILEAVACQGNNLNIIKVYFMGVQKIILSSHTGSYLYHNSFMPIIDIEIVDVHGKTQVYALFGLKKSTKVVMMIFYVFVFLFEISLLVHQMTHQLTIFPQLFYPLGIILLSYTFSIAGLFFSSKGVLGILYAALTREDTKNIPSIHKSKHIE